MTPSWLVPVLEDLLPGVVGAERDLLAERIVEAVPRYAIADVIATSAKAVLRTRDIYDEALAREIGNNAAQCVLFKIEGVA